MIQLQQQLEHKLRLPVVVSGSGIVYVLDAFGKNTEVFMAGRKNTAKFLRRRVKPAKMRKISIKLSFRYPEVSPTAVRAGLSRIEPGLTNVRSVHIAVDTGPFPPDWFRLEKFVSAIISSIRSKSRMPIAVTIDGVFTPPSGHYVDWLARRGIVARYVLGSALGFAGDVDGRTAKRLKAMSDEGLRVPVLFYWSGESASEVGIVLEKALRMNRFAGIGILPCSLSPRFDCRTMHNHCDSEEFSRIVSRLYADRTLCEHLEEPISDIEQRLADSPAAHYVRGLITENGDLLPFRHFPFAARCRPNGKTRLADPSRILAAQFKAPYCRQCSRCAWRHICGGVDAAPHGFRQQYKIVAGSWCEHRKLLMQRIIGECLEIRENLHQIKNQQPKDVKQ